MRLWSAMAGCLLLIGCTAGAAPLAIQSTPVPPPPPTSTPSPVPPTSTRVPTSTATLVPTGTPIPTATLVPTATPIPVPPTPTPDPNRADQQHYCDTASPPGRIALPPLVPVIKITPPESVTQPTAVPDGPRQADPAPAPTVTAKHVAIVDETSGSLMYSVDPFARAAPASITKIVTTIVALEHEPDITTTFTTSVSAAALVNCDGSSIMGLEPNDRVKLETLLYGMMLPSGNDAAEQVAISLGGSRQTFVAWMNEKVASLRLRDTHFVTPSGMDADEHYSSAYDMALLARYAMRNPEFRTIAATQRFVGDDYYMHNLNPLLGSYPGADGVKIGYTDIAGRTIVASATHDGHRVFVSLMGSGNLAADCTALFNWVWQTFVWS